MTESELLTYLEARAVRPHVDKVVFLLGYDGPAAYYDRSIILPLKLWETLWDNVELVQHDIGTGAALRGLPIVILDDHGDPELLRHHIAERAGLFGRLSNGEVAHG